MVIIFLISCNGKERNNYLAEITPEKSYESEFTSSNGEEFVISLNLSTESTSWEIERSESVVITVLIDEAYNQDVVVFGGENKLDYKFITGPLSDGTHRLTLEYSKEKSPAKNSKVFIYSIQLTPATDEYIKYSPFLYGRPEQFRDEPLNTYSDVPLVLFVEKNAKNGNSLYTYSIIWSNEDGGTGVIPPLLMAQYGRTTDIEWVYEIELDMNKNIVSESYQKVTHTGTPFTGQKIGLHPVLIVASNNNNMEQNIEDFDLKKNILYGLLPQYFTDLKTREEVMDANPRTYLIANQEMKRETLFGVPKMESPGDPLTPALSDYRNYLFLEFNLSSQPNLKWRFGAEVNGEWYYSDHSQESFKYAGNGYGRSAIELPEGTLQENVAGISVEVSGLTSGENAEITHLSAFMLDDDFVPHEKKIYLNETEILTSDNPIIVIR